MKRYPKHIAQESHEKKKKKLIEGYFLDTYLGRLYHDTLFFDIYAVSI